MIINNLSAFDLFDQYAYFLFCNDKDQSGKSRSLVALSEIANKSKTFQPTYNRKTDVDTLTKNLSPKMRNKILQLEKAAEGFYKINNDCDDDDYICETISHLKTALKEFKPNNVLRVKIRNAILNRLYDFSEQISPNYTQVRFELLKTMVADIKSNNGEYDHDPLNTTARRVKYFMRNISAQKRFTLLMTINNKTHDKQHYDYTTLLNEVKQECNQENCDKHELKRLHSQERYEQIRNQDFPAAKTNEEKIKLYNELLTLINDQNWGRIRKFKEKTAIYHNLSELYLQVGDIEQYKQACKNREKFKNAIYHGSEAARIKGYKSSNGY